MFLRRIAVLVALSGIAVLPLKAQLTFDSFPEGLYGAIGENGFTVSQEPAFFILEGSSSCSPPCPENGTPYLATQNGDIPVRVFSSDGFLFTIVSLDLAEQHVAVVPSCPEVTVTGFREEQSVASASFSLDGVNDGAGPLDDFQHLLLPSEFRGLTSVEFVCSNLRRYSLANLAVSPDVSEIPTLSPGGLVGLALLILSAGLLTLRQAKRRPLTLRSSGQSGCALLSLSS